MKKGADFETTRGIQSAVNSGKAIKANDRLRAKRFDKNTQVIFFDLEYYVPKEQRNNTVGLVANPYRCTGGFIIGGVFKKYYPLRGK